jgi:Fe2+ transport system protein B
MNNFVIILVFVPVYIICWKALSALCTDRSAKRTRAKFWVFAFIIAVVLAIAICGK